MNNIDIIVFDKTLSTKTHSSQIKFLTSQSYLKMYRFCHHISSIQLIEKKWDFSPSALVSKICATRYVCVVTKGLSKDVVKIKTIIPLGIVCSISEDISIYPNWGATFVVLWAPPYL